MAECRCVLLVAVAVEGYSVDWWARLLIAAGGLGLMAPGVAATLAGIGLAGPGIGGSKVMQARRA